MMPRLKLTYIAVLAAVLLPGCAMMGPDYQRPEMPVPAKFAEQADATNQAEISRT